MTDYPMLTASLDQRYAGLSRQGLTELVEDLYGPGVTPEDVEGFFDDIGRGLQHAAQGVGHFAQQAAPMVVKALPAMATGAASGSAFGPWGALIGAGAGLTSGLMSQSSNHTVRDIGGAIHSVGGLVSTVRGGGAGGAMGSLASITGGGLGGTPAGQAALGGMQMAQGGRGGGAANQLMGMLARPETLQALLAALMGSSGRQQVPIGGQQVPVSQMLAALSSVAGRAAHEAAEYETGAEATPEYASAAAEVLGIDPEDAEGRVDALLTLLALTPSLWMARQPAQIAVNVAPNDPFFPHGESFQENFLEDFAEDYGSEASDLEAWDEAFDEGWNDGAEFDEVIHA